MSHGFARGLVGSYYVSGRFLMRAISRKTIVEGWADGENVGRLDGQFGDIQADAS